MRIAYVTRAYRGVAAGFYSARPGLESESSAAQWAAFEAWAYGWCGAWGPALAPFGHELREYWLDLEPLQRAWAGEHGVAGTPAPATVLVEQLRAFRPEVIWLDPPDAPLIARVRAVCPDLRAVLGWAGSALGEDPVWRSFDFVLSCAPESVERLRARGMRADLLEHAFQERVLEALDPRAPTIALGFIGQIAPDHPLHVHRQRVIERLLDTVGLAIFSPSAEASAGSAPVIAVKRAVFGLAKGLRAAGLPATTLARWPVVGRAVTWPAPPRGALPARIRAAMRPGVFGMDLYRALRDQRATLNVHAGAATRFTSNMRLFEATGVGTCLLTDAAPNLPSLFEPGREVVAFTGVEDCVEKARWLLEHAAESEAVARAGQARCLASHTFRHRAGALDAVLRRIVAQG